MNRRVTMKYEESLVLELKEQINADFKKEITKAIGIEWKLWSC